MTKNCVKLNLTSVGSLKYYCVIKTEIEILIFLFLINNSVPIGFSFLILIISAIISSKTINTFLFYLDCNLQYFCRHTAYYLKIP